jgi:ubiquinone biosynthesis protein UbiJ
VFPGGFVFFAYLPMPPINTTPPPSTLMIPVIAAINHLLAQEAWAREALMLHAGKQACIDTGPLALRLNVTRDGMVEAGSPEAIAHVTIRVKLADLPLIAHQPERAFSHVKIEGDAEFANTISRLGRGLRWEAEHDLERWIGPIAATRMATGARSVLDSAQRSGQSIAENLAEYFLEEQPMLVRPAMLDEFASEVGRLRDDVERTAKRIARIEQALAKRQTPAAPSTPSTRTGGQQDLDL